MHGSSQRIRYDHSASVGGCPICFVHGGEVRSEYRRRPGVEEHRRGSLKALLCGLRSGLANHASLVDSVRGSLRQDMERDIDFSLQAAFAAGRDRTAGLHSATSHVVEAQSATLRQDASFILTHLDSRQAASTSEPSIAMCSDPLGPGAASPPL